MTMSVSQFERVPKIHYRSYVYSYFLKIRIYSVKFRILTVRMVHLESFICIFLSSSLVQVSSTLNADQENHLKNFLTRRLRKGAIYVDTGNFSGMDFR